MEDEKESLAGKAVKLALTNVYTKVLRKHKLRKDSWHRTTSVFAMSELVHNKMHRVKEILAKSPKLTLELAQEIQDEYDDIIAYVAFQLYELTVDKQLNTLVPPESDLP